MTKKTFAGTLLVLISVSLLGISSIHAQVQFTQHPATVRCVGGLPEVTLNWNAVPNIAHYKVQRKNSVITPWSGNIESGITDTRYVDKRWKPDYGVMTFYYRIRAVAADYSYSDYSTEVAVSVPECRTFVEPTPAPTVPTVKKWGVYTGWQNDAMDEFEKLTGKDPDMEMVFTHWGSEYSFPPNFGERIRDKGRTMVLFWEASDYKRDQLQQPEFSFDNVLAGKLDPYFKRFARDAKAYGGPIILIPYSEMNGYWYPWGGIVGTNTAAKYIASYRYLHGFFDDVPNVKFGWAPNAYSVPNIPSNQMERFYPGDDVVDAVGLDGFNFGGEEQMSFSEIFDDGLERLKQYKKPIYIFSMAAAEEPGKAAWIRDMVGVQLPRHPEITGWLWFNQLKERDWRINSDMPSFWEFVERLPALVPGVTLPAVTLP